MKRQLALLLILSCFFPFLPALAASAPDFQQKTIQATAEKNAVESTASDGNSDKTIKIQRQFTYVNPEQLPMTVSATLEGKAIANDNLNSKITAAYIPIHLIISNKSDKLLKIPFDSIYVIDAKGNKRLVPSESEVFRHIKRHGVRRALAWSVPIGVASFGILFIPAIVLSSVHTAITNGSLKTDLRQNVFNGGHLGPDSSMNAYLFLPKSWPSPVLLVLGRVINTEDDQETEKILNITKLETVKHADAK